MEAFMAETQPSTVPNLALQVETSQQRTHRFTRQVTLLSFILVGLATFLSLLSSIFGSWQAWSSATLIELIPAAFCWWLATYTNHYRSAAWINTITALIISDLLYWQVPTFGLYLLFLLQLIVVRIILGRTETLLVFGFLVTSTLLYLVLNDNRFYAPDEQLVKVDYGTFVLWWLLVGGVIWLTSYLYDTIQRDNHILNQQSSALKQTLEELSYKQTSSETESRRVLTLGAELSVIAKQQQVGSQQQVSSLNQVARFVEEMAQAANNIKTQTYEVRESANEIGLLTIELQDTFGEVLKAVDGGEKATRRTVEANQQVGMEYNHLREHLAELEQFQNQIRSVVEIINSVSQETHLLSLNAAIEAVGAGEYGERFSVVAREVKDLAKRVQHSSLQVTDILGRVKSGIEQVVKAADNAQGQVEVVLEAADEGQAMMERIVDSIGQNVKQVERITDAINNIKLQSSEVSSTTSQQSAASSQAVESLIEITEVASQNSMTSDQLRQSAVHLEQVSTSLVTALTTDSAILSPYLQATLNPNTR
jgi:methyl-accepting chemotaxis protein